MAVETNITLLNDLQQKFLSVFAERFPSGMNTMRTKDELCIEIAAKHPDVGPLSIRVNRDDATVVISYFHHHFDDYLTDKDVPRPVLVEKIVTAVCDFVAAVINNDVIFTFAHFGSVVFLTKARYVHDKYSFSVGGDCRIIPNGLKTSRFISHFTWSGPMRV